MVAVLKSRFVARGGAGDFSWMIEQPQHDRTLFIFNDNVEEFLQHLRDEPHTCQIGDGNATIRPYQCLPQPRAAGIPTGYRWTQGAHYKGFSVLDDLSRGMVDLSISHIERLLRTGRFDTLAFSWDDNTKLGGRIFTTAQPVRDYIVEQLLSTAERY